MPPVMPAVPSVRDLPTAEYIQLLIETTEDVQRRHGDVAGRSYALITRNRIAKKVQRGCLSPEEGLTLLDHLNTTLEQLKLA